MPTSTLTGMTYRIYDNMEGTGFVVEGPDGMLLCTPDGTLRVFSTRNSARKRIARERSGNFHK